MSHNIYNVCPHCGLEHDANISCSMHKDLLELSKEKNFCYLCRREIKMNDDEKVCIKCGGRNLLKK